MDNISNESLTEKIKKSKLFADGYYDMQKLILAGEHFLPMEYEENEEEIIFHYNIEKLFSFTDISNEDFIVILNILMQAAKFHRDAEKYSFSMEPLNLYYNSNGTVHIKSRDLYDPKGQRQDFLKSYKALCGCALTGEYTYRDYTEGGEELYNKNTLTEALYKIEDLGELVGYLEETKKNYIQKQRRDNATINRKLRIGLIVSAAILFISTVSLGIYSWRQYYVNVPYLTAVNQAGDAYIENDMLGIIDALREIEVEDMDRDQKYILARSYLQSENLTDEQKTNISEKLILTSNQREFEYWIYLGRLEVEAAEDRAIQLSDDELLLYAYMKDKEQTEANTTMDGEEKSQRLQELQANIDTLTKKYNLDEDEEVDETEPENGQETNNTADTEKATE